MSNRFCFGALLLACLAWPLAGCNDTSSGLDSITISPNTNLQLVVGNPATLQLTVTGTYGNGKHPTTGPVANVVWTSAIPLVATVSSSGVVSAVSAGTTTITATAQGFNGPVSASVQVTVSPCTSGCSAEPIVSLSITPSTDSVALAGQTAQFIALGTTSAGLQVNLTVPVSGVVPGVSGTHGVAWSVTNTGVASIGANTGLATAVGQGTTPVTAIWTNPDNSVVTATASLTVTGVPAEPLVSLAIVPASQTLTVAGQTSGLIAIGTTSTGATVNLTNQSATIGTATIAAATWRSSVASVASIISTTGVATAIANGTTAITATATNPDGTIVTGVATLTVNIPATPEPLVSLSIVPSSQMLTAAGQTAGLIAIGTTSSGATVNLTNQSATIGTATIQAATWRSSVPSVATINSTSGVATAVANGTTAITATATNPDGTVVTGIATLTVSIPATPEPLVSLSIVPASQTLTEVNQTAGLIAIGTTSSGATVNLTNQSATIGTATIAAATWRSSVASVASIISTTGVATALANGTTAITATATNPDGTVVTGTATLTVNIPATSEPLVSLAIVPASQTLTVANQTAGLIAIGTTSSGATVNLTNQSATIGTATIAAATWKSSVPSVATINSTSGVATAVANGTTAITATATNPDGTVVTGIATLTVSIPATPEPLVSLSIVPASQTLTSANQTAGLIVIGTTSTGATVNLTDQSATIGTATIAAATWKSSVASVATIDPASGIVTAHANGTTAITAMAINPDNTVVTGTATLTVAIPATPEPLSSMSIVPGSQTVAAAGQTTQFMAIGNFSASSTTPGAQNMANITTYTVVWYSSNPAVATINSSTGLVTGVGVGTTAITAIATNNADHSGVSATATFTVSGPATTQVTSLSIIPSSQTVTLPLTTPTVPTTYYVAIGTNGAYGLQENETNAVTWSSSNTAVATISNIGVTAGGVTVYGQGTTTIMAQYPNPASGSTPANVVTATATLTVNGVAAEPLLSLAIQPAAQTVAFPGQSSQLTAIGTFSVAPVSQNLTSNNTTYPIRWTSSDISVATVGSPEQVGTVPGLVTAVGQGTAAITAIASNPDGSVVTGVCAFTVTNGAAQQITALSIIPNSLALSATGQPGNFIALGTMGGTGLIEDVTNSSQLVWSSSVQAYATITTYPATNAGQVVGVSPGSTTITAEWTNPATGSTPSNVVTATASVSVTTTAAAEPLLSIIVVPSSLTTDNLYGTGQFLAYGTFSTTPTVVDITNGFYHAGFPGSSCTAALAASGTSPCTLIPVNWISAMPSVFPVNSSGAPGSTAGLVTADGSGNAVIYVTATNPDSTLVYSPTVTFNCPLALPTYNSATPPVMTNPGTCNPYTIANGLLVTLTVFNTGLNQTNWLVTAPSATGTPNVIHCGGSTEQAAAGGSVCMATYPINSTILLTAPAETGVHFGGWSYNCTPSDSLGNPLPGPVLYTAAGPNYCTVTLGATDSNVSVGAIFN